MSHDGPLQTDPVQAGHGLGVAGRVARYFIDSKLTPLIVLASLLLGVLASVLTPREEEPQILVPMIDISVQMPGVSAAEVEQRVTKPMEKLLWEIPGVEYIYSTSSPGMAMAIVRFYVGQNEEDSLVKAYNKLFSNYDIIPPGCSEPLMKLRTIDDVPVLALTFWGEGYDSLTLRRVAAQIEDDIKEIRDVASTTLIGGARRQIGVDVDRARMTGHGVCLAQVAESITRANRELPAGAFAADNRRFLVDTGDFLQTAEDVGAVVIGARTDGTPVYLRDIATITDGPEEPRSYVLFGAGSACEEKKLDPTLVGRNFEAVTLAVAKRKGTNAATISSQVLRKVESLRGVAFPSSLNVTTTRNYGETATEKSNELLRHVLEATLSVTLLIALLLGWREGGVVLIAVPVTLALTLLVFFLFGYTLNRITLFALIFSIGILVDDAIVVVENIVRHFRLPGNAGRPTLTVAVEAVAEVGNPTILATLTVIAAILPLAFVRGLMGPYMLPIPIGASAAMTFSLFIAFVISPWAAVRLIPHGGRGHGHGEGEGWTTRAYRRFMGGLLRSAVRRWAFLFGVVALLLAACSMVYFRLVLVKMLPYDNKSEFQVILDMPEDVPLEQTNALISEIGRYLATIPEVTDYQGYAGTAAPFNFNGLVRHYYLRGQPFEGDIQVNLTNRHHRKVQSHGIAKRVRPTIQEIAAPYGARVKVAEVPPGPPVLQTLVAEVYGPTYERQRQVAQEILGVFENTPNVVDADWYMESDQTKYRFVVDKEKAALNGISTDLIAQTMTMALNGQVVGLAHIPEEKEDVDIVVRLPETERSSVDDLRQIRVMSPIGRLVPIGELAAVEPMVAEKSIYHKNLQPVVYVTADMAGTEESPVYAIFAMNRAIDQIQLDEGYRIKRYTTHQPFVTDRIAMKWDGEWHITYEVFRDMGLAFAAVMVLIYILVVGEFQSFTKPIVILSAIPFSLAGILPAHWLAGAYFTATSMIGFIAGAGIVVRNSIILVDFIELRLRSGYPLVEAVVDAGAVRFRPMLLTAAALVVGASFMLSDPIFQGMALALMGGEVASLLLSRMTVPVLYFLLGRHEEKARDRRAARAERRRRRREWRAAPPTEAVAEPWPEPEPKATEEPEEDWSKPEVSTEEPSDEPPESEPPAEAGEPSPEPMDDGGPDAWGPAPQDAGPAEAEPPAEDRPPAPHWLANGPPGDADAPAEEGASDDDEPGR